jgi:hypothetical protein
MRIRFVAAFLAAAALASVSCGGITDPSKNQTETFSGTITPVTLGGNGQGPLHNFNIGSNGEFTVKVTAMTPTFNSFFGTYMGTGENCTIGVGQNTLSIVGGQALSGPIFQKGTYCVFVFDIGNMTASENYTLTVSHP